MTLLLSFILLYLAPLFDKVWRVALLSYVLFVCSLVSFSLM